MQRRDHQDGLTGNVEILLDSLDTDKQFFHIDNNALVFELYIIEYKDMNSLWLWFIALFEFLN